MANTSYYAKKKEEQDKKLQQALDARSRRIQSSLPDILKDIQNSYESEINSYNSTKPAYGAYDDTYSNHRERQLRIDNLRKKINAYRKYIGSDAANSILSTLDQMDKGYDAYIDMSQYTSENDYNKAVEHAKAAAEVKSAGDFGSYSGYVSTKADNLWDKMWSQYGLGYEDLTYEYINNQGGIRDEIKRKSSTYRSDTKDSKSIFEENNYDYMTPDEVSVYNYYYAKHGKEKAEEYLSSIGSTLEARANGKTVEAFSQFASDHPILSSALSVGTSLGSGFEYIEDVVDYAKDKISGKPARLGTNEAALITNTVRGTVSDLVDWEIGNWDAFDFVYGTVMSGVDSFAASLTGPVGGASILGLSAAAQGTNDALDRGMSDGQAFWNGLFSGAFEALFEKFSLGNLNSLKEVAPDSIKTVFKNLGKSMLVNASEEAATEIANIAYDTLINGEFANYTIDELKSGQWKNALQQVLESGASGAFMGLGMGGIGNAIGHSKASRSEERRVGKECSG